MAVKNREEIITAVGTELPSASEITATEHRALLENSIVNSVLIRKDVIVNDGAQASPYAADFASTDRRAMTTQGNTAISFSGLEDGDIRFLTVIKTAGHVLTFTGGVVNSTDNQTVIDEASGTIDYMIVKKALTYVLAITKTLNESTLQNLLDGVANKYITPDKLQTNVWYEVGNDGGNTVFINGWVTFSPGLFYKVDIFGNLIIEGKAAGENATSKEIFKFNDVSIIPTTSSWSLTYPMGVCVYVLTADPTVSGFTSGQINSSNEFEISKVFVGTNPNDRFETRNLILRKS